MARFNMANKHVLISGASTGLGAALAVACARKGARLSLVARDEEALERVAGTLRSTGAAVCVFPFDLVDVEHIPDLVKRIAMASDAIDVLINNAAICVAGRFEDIPLHLFRRAFAVNVLAPVGLMAAVIPEMKARRTGQIVNITSALGTRGVPWLSPYCATKFALNGLTESVRGELRPWGIHVLLVSPGSLATGFNSRIELVENVHINMPVSHPTDPERIARKIVTAVERRKREVVVRNAGWMLGRLNQVAPSLVDRVVARAFTVS
jgi:short-subunit dehydrogenase